LELRRVACRNELMGGLAAILRWDGGPIADDDLQRVAGASAYRAHDGIRSRGAASNRRAGDSAPSLAMAHLRFATTEPFDDHQPLVDAARGLAFVFDGRLDNRPELLSRLALTGDGRISDAALALEAFARWDLSAAAQLLGDFAFIAWDDRRRRFVCARDHMGIRHLHFHVSPRLIVCATDIAQVIAHPDVPREPDPAVAADYIACDVRNGERTLYRGVSRVPPGHVVAVEHGDVRVERYWSAEPRAPIRHATDDEYAAHCRELLTRSVAARMRGDRPIAAMLSGGLDSSSVMSAAWRLVKTSGQRPQPFSMVFPARAESDERPFLHAVARHCGTSVVEVLPDPITGRALLRQSEMWTATPAMPADEMAATLYAAMVERGHRATLTGAGGDFLFTGSVFQYADLLRQGRPVAAVKRFIDDWYAGETGRSALGLVQHGVWPLLPRAMKDSLRPLARKAVSYTDRPEWLRVDRTPDEPLPDAPRGGSFATEDVTRHLGSGMHTFFVECAERFAARAGIELRHPLLDKRLVEFALDIPDDQRKRGRFTKFVLRQALGDDLVECVRLRRTKGDFAHAIAEAIEAVGGEQFFESLQIAEAGWVHGDLVADKYRAMRGQYRLGPEVYGEHVPALWMITAVELWFRSAFGGTSAAGAPHGLAI
jgi:asparagine synthase (glutamine-hydrolysing)